MSQYPNSPDLGNQSQSGDSVFENIWVFGKFNYTFEGDDVGIRSIDIREPSIFRKSVTATSFDGPATQLTVEDENVDTECFPIFSKDSTGNVEPKTGTALRYNSSNGTLRAEKFSGDGSLLTNIQAGQVQGNSIFVSGMIILWSGAEVDIPTGFTLCNGQNNTPDLRSRFVVGAGTGGNYSVNATGGSADATLVSHQHGPGSYSTSSDGGHTHTYNFRSGTERADNDEDHQRNSGSQQYNTGSSGAHTHTISGSSSTEGSSATNANLPPYYALCYIMKT